MHQKGSVTSTSSKPYTFVVIIAPRPLEEQYNDFIRNCIFQQNCTRNVTVNLDVLITTQKNLGNEITPTVPLIIFLHSRVEDCEAPHNAVRNHGIYLSMKTTV